MKTYISYVEEKFRLEIHILATNIILKFANCSVKQKLALIKNRRALQDDLRALVFDNTHLVHYSLCPCFCNKSTGNNQWNTQQKKQLVRLSVTIIDCTLESDEHHRSTVCFMYR